MRRVYVPPPMALDPHLPVVVGVAQLTRRLDSEAGASEPLAMMQDVIEAAAADAGPGPALLEKVQSDLVRSQAEAMQAQVQSYLNRARIAAQRESLLARADVEPVLERLVRVMRRLNPEKEFHLSVFPPGMALGMEQQDVEVLAGGEPAGRDLRDRVVRVDVVA